MKFFITTQLVRRFVFCLIVFSYSVVLNAQNQAVITVGIPGYLVETFDQTFFDEFYTTQPGVKVVPVVLDDSIFVPPLTTTNFNEYTDKVAQYVSQADVLFLEGFDQISIEATRANYFLDLSPLASVDVNSNNDDFSSSIWKSYQWDNGLWAIPNSFSLQMLVYQPTRFDEVGLAYPSANWTIEDFVHATNILAVYDNNSQVLLPGVDISMNTVLFFRSLLGQGFFNDAVIPDDAWVNQPKLIDLMRAWKQVEEIGLTTPAIGSNNLGKIPLRLEEVNPVSITAEQEAVSFLPGGIAGLTVNAFAVSRGTNYPEFSYALAQYLSYKPQIAARFPNKFTARTSLMNILNSQADDPILTDVLNDALSNALPLSELRYGNYVFEIYAGGEETTGFDLEQVFAIVQARAMENGSIAELQQGETYVNVSTPIPINSLADGEISLRFGVYSSSPLNFDAQWTDLVTNFVLNDPEVGGIDLVAFDTFPAFPEDIDCFFTPFNWMFYGDLTTIRNLDPFIDADITFTSENIIGDAFSQLRAANYTWGLPVVLYPTLLRYNREIFERAGIPEPQGTWTINEFDAVLPLIKTVLDEDIAPFSLSGSPNLDIFMLASAYGSIIYDLSTIPPTMNLTTPEAMDALRHILDLVKTGLIQYPNPSSMDNYDVRNSPIYPDTIRNFEINNASQDPVWGLVTYPQGRYVPSSFAVGSVYITSQTTKPEACYRWATTVAQHPNLFNGMPVLHSLLNDPITSISQGEIITSFYQAFAEQLEDPTAIIFSTNSSGAPVMGGRNAIEQNWIGRAFNNYMFNNSDLALELEQAQNTITEYRACVAQVPPVDKTSTTPQEESTRYGKEVMNCILLVDPDIETIGN